MVGGTEKSLVTLNDVFQQTSTDPPFIKLEAFLVFSYQVMNCWAIFDLFLYESNILNIYCDKLRRDKGAAGTREQDGSQCQLLSSTCGVGLEKAAESGVSARADCGTA
jgi:hypothetical protein